MFKTKQFIAAALLLLAASGASAGVILDTGANAYWGGNDHKLGDVIGTAMYNISGATVTRTGSLLHISIATAFAGHAGADTWATPKGIGYGDVFLAAAWKPFGLDAHHLSDKAANGTKWSYGLNLDNRWSNSGGSFTLYELNGATNAGNILNSESFITCALGSACYYRDGQATAVKTTSSSVRNTGIKGTWSVLPNAELRFSVDLGATALAASNTVALHWGETCQNDVIEGLALVPEPGGFALFGLGALALGLVRRRNRA